MNEQTHTLWGAAQDNAHRCFGSFSFLFYEFKDDWIGWWLLSYVKQTSRLEMQFMKLVVIHLTILHLWVATCLKTKGLFTAKESQFTILHIAIYYHSIANNCHVFPRVLLWLTTCLKNKSVIHYPRIAIHYPAYCHLLPKYRN